MEEVHNRALEVGLAEIERENFERVTGGRG